MQAATLHKLENSNGVNSALNSDPLTIVSPTGTPIHVDKGWLARMEKKLSEQITLSKGTLWLIATVLVIANLAFNYVGSALTYAREDGSTKTKIEALTVKVDQMAEQQSKMRDDVIELKINVANEKKEPVKK